MSIKWKWKPKPGNYKSAKNYLTLLFEPRVVGEYVEELKRAKVSCFMAKDIFRASRLPLLGLSNARMKEDAKRIKNGTPLSPILLIRGKRLIVADGYHRMCAVYSKDERIWIPCKIV